MVAVPWNAGWTSEERFEVRPCRWADGQLALWQPHNPGVGDPIFAKPHCVRQRRSIAEMICTVCGQKTAPADRWWFGLGDLVEEKWLTSEAPVHRLCADIAFEVCPRLRSRGRRPEPLPPGYKIYVTQIGGDDVERDFGITIQAPIAGALKIGWPASRVSFI